MALTPEQLAELQRLKQMYAPLVEAQRRRDQADANAQKMGIPLAPPDKKAKGGEVEDDYRSEHTAPSPEFGAPMHDVTRDMYPKDFYGPNGFRYYADFGEHHDREAYDKVRQVKDKPNEMVSIHRAIPTSVYKEALKKDAPLRHMIRPGDWVAISKQYAKDHGESVLKGDYKIASMRVPARHVWTNGDSVHEWGYHPVEHKAAGGIVYKAQGGNMPTLAQMRMALARRGNPIEMQSIGINEAPGLSPKVYLPPDLAAKSFQPAPGGVATQAGMPIGGIDMSKMNPGQQLMPQQPGQAPGTTEQPGRSATGQPQGNQPGQQPSPPPTGFGAPGSLEAQPAAAPPGPPSNILSMTPQGRALSAIGPGKMPGLAGGGGVKQQGVTMGQPKSTRMVFQAEGSGGVKGINVPRHMWEGSSGVIQKGARAGQEFKTPGMKEVNAMRAKVYGAENRDPLTIGQIGRIHKDTLAEHFAKPLDEQVKAEKEALGRLREAGHIGKTADTLDESEKLDTVRHEHDEEGRTHVGFASKGVAGHALYTSGHGENMKHHVVNTCPGQTEGCGGGKDAKGIVDTTKGTCFAPVAEAQYPGAAVRRASHEQAKHDPAMTRDWILAHTGSIRDAANSADKKNQRMLFRPNVVDETDTSSRHVIRHLNEQRKQEDKPGIIANSYGKTNELHDPENGYHVTHSNVGPKVKGGKEISENIGRDKQRVQNTIMAANAKGADFKNEQGNETPPKGSYMVTNVKRGSPLSKKMQEHITHAKYWSTGRSENELSDAEKAEGEEGHYSASGRKTTPDKAHYGHTTLNGRRYDYQKQHILHPRLVQVGENKDGTPHMIPTDSRFKDTEFLPKNRFKSKNGKDAGHILMTTPTESTSNVGHETSFTHHVDENSIKHAMANNGEYEIDKPEDQEKARGKEYVAPQEIKFSKTAKMASGGSVASRHPGLSHDDFHAFPEQNYAAQRHLAMRMDPEERGRDSAYKHGPKAVIVKKSTDAMRHEMMTRRKG